MYRKEFMIGHSVFLIIDIVSLAAGFWLASIIRFHRTDFFFDDELSIYIFSVALLGCLVGNYALRLEHHYFDRGMYRELLAAINSTLFTGSVELAFLFLVQRGNEYSRMHLAYFMAFYLLLSYICHALAKWYIVKYYKKSNSLTEIMLVTTADRGESVLERFESSNNWYFRISCITILDEDRRGSRIRGIPVIATEKDMLEEVKNIPLDGVFINISYGKYMIEDIRKMLHDFQSMGIVVHVNIQTLELDVADKVIESLGIFKVVTYASRLREPGQLLIKRGMDIAGAIIGGVATVIVGIFLGVAIKLDSPGPVIFSQERVGKNGRHFKMYKFRSMYSDAEERKRELLEQNEMKGAMFKMEADPRITRVGRFIRKYSIDEMPQFFNVLKGDMSLVGTRPPLAEEVKKYRVEQKRRLSVTPGMTGMWQTMGRNEIYDFDEIVKLDLEYIDRWSIGLDIKLIFKTILVCIKGKGAR